MTDPSPILPDPLAGDRLDRLRGAMDGLTRSADQFGRSLVGAFARGASAGRSLEDVLRSIGLRFVDMALNAALQPAQALAGSLFAGFGRALGGVSMFADGGVVSRPTYFPTGSGIGLMGEAGAEAILPLARGPDGKLGVRSGAGAGVTVNVSISTPDVEGFRRSEAQVAATLARAVARGQRGL